MSHHVRMRSADADGLFPPSRAGKDGRSAPGASTNHATRAPGSFAPSLGPHGTYTPDVKPTIQARNEPSRQDYFTYAPAVRAYEEQKAESEQKQAQYRGQLDKEVKIKIGSENLLEALNFKKHAKDQRLRVENELDTTNRKIAQLKNELAAEVVRSQAPQPPPPSRLSQLFQSAGRSPARPDFAPEEDPNTQTESPTYVLTETLQSLEAVGLPSDYYVEHANNLVELFKRHSTLKYDLVWSIFGLRVQGMLLSGSREVAAAGFRMARFAFTDRRSLSIIRSFQTDYLVMLALLREGKNTVEREQALKFVRAFLDVKEGVEEIPRHIVRVLVAISEQHDDRLHSICLLTLSEILVLKPALVVSAGGMGPMTDALSEGTYHPSDSLTSAFLYLLDCPARRKYLQSGLELQGPFAAFSDATSHLSEERLRTNAKVVASLLKSWAGLMALSMNGFLAIKSLTTSLYVNSTRVRDVVLEIILDALRIKSPSWSASFLAGRRLTTYGRFMNVKVDPVGSGENAQDKGDGELVRHFRALLLAVFIQSGLIDSLVFALQHEQEPSIRRKATLLIGEALDLANDVLPSSWTQRLQVLPGLFDVASSLGSEDRFNATGLIYQIDSVNRTLFRTGRKGRIHAADFEANKTGTTARRPSDLQKDTLTPQIEEGVFRAVLVETQVMSTPNYTKWRWDLIQKIIEGPLMNPKRLDEAIRASKFVKRLVGFYRPFKYRFADIRNTKPNQRYVRVGCALMRTLLHSPEGVKYLAENKLLRQIAECLAQVDRLSGLTSAAPLFAPDRLTETLSGGYFALLGTFSGSVNGLAIIERWRMANMFYHIVELQDRDDLIKALLSNMDYSLDSHLRLILSKALTSCAKPIRVFSTRLLRKYAVGQSSQQHQDGTEDSEPGSQWAIDMLVTQLYDPQVEVCEVAIKILEEACNNVESLEYVVQCRPALDHLGEIGAPLLLRFLSTSIGYHYLDNLDYISQEMDDWFLGRNDTYVRLVEASMARALSGPEDRRRQSLDEAPEEKIHGTAPPHFYRELTRTSEGCKLLESKGHFDEFVSVVQTWGFESIDAETITKVKGSLWAIGNIGSMELGAPFLEQSDVVEHIVRIAEGSEVMSMRGTAFFVLGLISRSVHGQELLAGNGWDVAFDDEGHSLCVCLPQDLGKLFAVCITRRFSFVTFSLTFLVTDKAMGCTTYGPEGLA